MNILERPDSIVVDLTDIPEGKNITIKLPDKFNNPKYIARKSDFKIFKANAKKVEFTEVDVTQRNKNVKLKVPKNKSVIQSPELSKKPFTDVSPADWRQKHLVQFVKYYYKKEFGSLPLELKWEDTGYTTNAKERSKSWAYAKSLMNRFEKLEIPKKKIPQYIEWAFAYYEITPTMSLLQCSNWIDTFKFNVLRKRKKSVEKIVGENIDRRKDEWTEAFG